MRKIIPPIMSPIKSPEYSAKIDINTPPPIIPSVHFPNLLNNKSSLHYIFVKIPVNARSDKNME